jgi:RimJ/RimL family protein N-acetyltransferase
LSSSAVRNIVRAMQPIETDRLHLRPLEPERDAPFMLEVLNDPAFIRNVADRGVRTVADAEQYICEKMMPSYTEFGFGFFVLELKETGVPVGMCGLIKRPVLADVDIGYSLLPAFWGNGYAYEAARAVMDYGLRMHKLPRIVGITAPHNHSSIKVLEKLGLRFERMFRMPGYETDSMLFT